MRRDNCSLGKVKYGYKMIKNDARGLTLVELLAVIVIIAIVGTITSVIVCNLIENAKKDAHIVNVLNILSAAKIYDASNGNKHIDEMLKVETLINESYLEPLIDPWTKEEYGIDTEVYRGKVGATNQITYLISNLMEKIVALMKLLEYQKMFYYNKVESFVINDLNQIVSI